jgi:hypothetical protein
MVFNATFNNISVISWQEDCFTHKWIIWDLNMILFATKKTFLTYIYKSEFVNESNFFHILCDVFNATFNNISVISWQSVLLSEETGVPLRKPQTISTKYWPFLNKLKISHFKMRPFYTSYYETCVCFKVSRSLEKR